MPDIQTAMTNALSKQSSNEMTHINNLLTTWADEPPTTMTTPTDKRVTNNVSRVLFNYVLDNPGRLKKQIVHTLDSKGFKAASTTSLLSQFVRCGLVRIEDGKLYAAAPAYNPLYKQIAKAKKPRRVAKSLPKTIAAHAAPMPIEGAFDTKRMIASLSVYQARDLYTELREMFGG